MAMVADFLVSNLRERLLAVAKDGFAEQTGMLDGFEMLQGALEELQFYLQDAEKKSIADASTNRWLCQVKDVIFDLDDELDEYLIHVEGGGGDKVSSFSTKPRSDKAVCCDYPILSCLKKAVSKHSIRARIEDIANKLKRIMNQMPRLRRVRDYNPSSGEAWRNALVANMSCPVTVRPDVVGSRIHLNARNLVGSLIMEDQCDEPLVYGIVGTGGIGKTTLARLVKDSSNIKNHFDLKIWVSLTPDCGKVDTLRKVVESFSKIDERGHSLSVLQEKFKEKVNGKKVFMVLDGVWEVDGVWNRLFKSLLESATMKCTCKVLVTTRSKEVAVQMKAVYFLQMEPLLLEDGWLLLRKAVLSACEEQEEEGDDAWGLKELGVEFVKKCNGLPLAIKVIGGVLSAESRTREAWASVLMNSDWEVKGLPEGIHRALYVSYQYLPLHVKQCILYCSLIPEDVIFKSIIAFEHWVQEGFIKEEDYRSWFDDGERYLWLLVQRNLLVFGPNCYDGSTFLMHDLIRSLCLFLMKNESLVGNEEEFSSTKSSARKMKLRRLSIVGAVSPKCLQKQASLRSILFFDQSISRIDDDLFNHLRCLRVLYLEKLRITELPESVGALTQLRYLNLSSTLINQLPQSTGNLRNLRVLIVTGCLHLAKLPPCVMNLHRLLVLATFDSALSNLPLGLGRLNQLRVLEFILPLETDEAESSSLEVLNSLPHLRELALKKLERVLDVSKAKAATLKGKQLEILQLSCSRSEPEAPEDRDRLEEVFEELCPPSQLKYLVISNYCGRKLPSWISPAPLNLQYVNLRHMRVEHCTSLKQFPALGLLPSLEGLGIEGASSVESIGPEFYVIASSPEASSLSPSFPKLKHLVIINMENWEEWRSPGAGAPTMASLEVLHIGFCPKLKSLPEDLLYHSKNMKLLKIEKSGMVQIELEHNVHSLEILILH